MIDPNWNAARKRDRQLISGYFLQAAHDYGATVEAKEEPRNPGFRGGSIRLRFELNGVGASMSIDDLHGGKDGLISFYNADFPSADFSPAFHGAVRNFPGIAKHKATAVGEWGILLDRFRAALAIAKEGAAFGF